MEDVPKILIVDDEIAVCQHLKALLSSFGYQSGFISHPKALFPRLEKEPFDLILMDVNMPQIDGVSLLKQVKALPNKNIPVVMLTGEGSDRLLALCLENGADDYIDKPINKVILKARVQSILSTYAHIREVQLQRDQMNEELIIAEDAQRFMLPKPVDIPFLKTSILYQPFGRVSGDTYNLKINKEGALNVFLGDGTGHGVAAAFITMMVQMELHNIQQNKNTAQFMRDLNTRLFPCLMGHIFMAGIYIRMFPDGTFKMTNAGNPPPLLVSKEEGTVTELLIGGQVLGMFDTEFVPYTEHTHHLQPGDKLFVFTDGIYEWEDQAEEFYGLERMETFLAENRAMEIDALLTELVKQVEAFAGNVPRADDITILGFEYLGAPP